MSLLPTLMLGKPSAFDFAITSPLISNNLPEAYVTARSAAFVPIEAIDMFNSSVHPSDIIHISSLLEKFHSQKALSNMLDNHLFNDILLGSLTIADRARLLSASSPHASLWLTVIPSERQDKMLDPLGHHATTCKRGGDVVFRHNKLRDIMAETCRRAHFSVQVEAGCNLTSDHSHSRPADVLISNCMGSGQNCMQPVTYQLHHRYTPKFLLKRE
ncbi:hypothetical protein EMCRGX_G002121 [Ephydatia muelleri]